MRMDAASCTCICTCRSKYVCTCGKLLVTLPYATDQPVRWGIEAPVKRSTAAPHYRTIFAVGIGDSTARTDMAKADLRYAMYDMLDNALCSSGIIPAYRDNFIDRGDGVLTLIRPVDQVPKTLLLNQVVPTLESLLCNHNAGLPSRYIRLKVAVHAGEVHYDRGGCFGEALDITCRLLDAPEVKRTLVRVMPPLALVVSEMIYQSVVRHDYQGIDGRAFEGRVVVNVAGQCHRGWIKISNQVGVDRSTGSHALIIDASKKASVAWRMRAR